MQTSNDAASCVIPSIKHPSPRKTYVVIYYLIISSIIKICIYLLDTIPTAFAKPCPSGSSCFNPGLTYIQDRIIWVKDLICLNFLTDLSPGHIHSDATKNTIALIPCPLDKTNLSLLIHQGCGIVLKILSP